MKKKRITEKPVKATFQSRATAPGSGCVDSSCRPPLNIGERTNLGDRPLLAFGDAAKLMALFKVLANDTRIRLLHHLIRTGEATVTDIANNLGMKVQAVSNQLARLSYSGILSSRREGNNILYRVANGCVSPMLDLALCLMEDQCRQPPPLEFRKTGP